jgi:hypothetical protein
MPSVKDTGTRHPSGYEIVLRRTVTVFVIGLAAGCSSETSLVDPGPDDTTGGGGTVQRVNLAITVHVHADDVPVAAAIGSPGGVLSGATVVARRMGTVDSLVAQSDAAGSVQFSSALAGTYTVSVVRLLSDSERAQLDPSDADVTAFGGGGQVNAQASGGGTPTVAVNVATVAGRRGSLVISELWAHAPSLPAGGYYYTGDYLELYNNGDTTVYLDGKVVGIGISWLRDYAGTDNDCASMAQWRLDPLGIWSGHFYRFPGTGQIYALAAGEAVVVATDAIDHRQYLSTLQDLSGADFEFVGPSDVDNPSVPNMVNIGLREWNAAVVGHGLYFNSINRIVFVADSLDPATLVHDNLPVNSPDHVRIPASELLDVFTSIMKPGLETTLTPACPQLVNMEMDRAHAELLDYNTVDAIRRNTLLVTPSGHPLLQRTKTSARDFTTATPTPGQVP